LRAVERTSSQPTSETGLGFRVACGIPEPNTLVLAAIAGIALLRRRWSFCTAILSLALIAIGRANPALADSFGAGADIFDIEFVTIGNPGNGADITGNPNPTGSVPYRYRIGKYEISEQMIEKANAEGGLSITKDIRGPNKPATSISWNEAARFVNWLNASTGNPPAYKFGSQPGEPGYTANSNIELWTAGDAGYDPNNLFRNSLARYFLPSIHEWYKAAYCDPISSVYYNYPTGSDVIPAPVANGTTPGTAVFGGQAGPADIKLAGGLSPNGTMAQGGNVYEWAETEGDRVNDSSTAIRVLRGGDWSYINSAMHAAFPNFDFPPHEGVHVGFRVASVIPEPSTLLLVAMAGLGLLLPRHVENKHDS
jgi:hypothetical protein